jgi:hypothetical protein
MTTKEEAEKALDELYVKIPSKDLSADWYQEDIDEVETGRLRGIIRSRLTELETEVKELNEILREKNDEIHSLVWSGVHD